MELSEKLKNIYDLRYQTFLTFVNTFFVGLIAIWIAIFIQSDINIFPMQYKLLISATIINIGILSLFYLRYRRKEVEINISQLNNSNHNNKLYTLIKKI